MKHRHRVWYFRSRTWSCLGPFLPDSVSPACFNKDAKLINLVIRLILNQLRKNNINPECLAAADFEQPCEATSIIKVRDNPSPRRSVANRWHPDDSFEGSGKPGDAAESSFPSACLTFTIKCGQRPCKVMLSAPTQFNPPAISISKLNEIRQRDRDR